MAYKSITIKFKIEDRFTEALEHVIKDIDETRSVMFVTAEEADFEFPIESEANLTIEDA
jgi:hypothetical protein